MRGKEFRYQNSRVETNDLALLYRYAEWRNRFFGYQNGDREKEDNRVSLLRGPDMSQQASVNKREIEQKQSSANSKGRRNKNRFKNMRVAGKKEPVKENVNQEREVDFPILQKVSLNKSVDKKTHSVKSVTKKQEEKNTNSIKTAYLDIPMGFNQIQNRLNSLTHRRQRAEFSKPLNGANGASMNQLVLDETRTNIGGEFFAAFNNQWQLFHIKTDYTIAISEKPLPSLGTMIIVKVNNELAYQSRLNPNNQYINLIVRDAILYVRQKMQNQQIMGY